MAEIIEMALPGYLELQPVDMVHYTTWNRIQWTPAKQLSALNRKAIHAEKKKELA